MSKNKLTGFHVMGLKCYKCKNKLAGGLLIPLESKYTPEILGSFLTSNRILPICGECHKANPYRIDIESLEGGL